MHEDQFAARWCQCHGQCRGHPHAWYEAVAPDGSIYYYNTDLGTSSWTKPESCCRESVTASTSAYGWHLYNSASIYNLSALPFACLPVGYAPPPAGVALPAPPSECPPDFKTSMSQAGPAPTSTATGGTPGAGQTSALLLYPSPLSALEPKLVPPPPLPKHLRPQSPQPGQENFYRRKDNWPGRQYHRHVGEQIHQAQEVPFNIRHDIIIEKRVIGRILGKGARDLEQLKAFSGAEIFIIDKHPPPGESDDHRLLILIGRPPEIAAAKKKIDLTLERARQELPPLGPPFSAGWRPNPMVGGGNGQGQWELVPEAKRTRTEHGDNRESWGQGGEDSNSAGSVGVLSGPLLVQHPDGEGIVELNSSPPPASTMNFGGSAIVANTTSLMVNCHNCGGAGHFARDCPKEVCACHNCGQRDHFARDCPSARKPFKAEVCHHCGSEGHFIRDCPVDKARPDYVPSKCHICGMEGHFARECQRNRNRLQAEEIRCSICSEVGHVARGCPHKGLYGIF